MTDMILPVVALVFSLVALTAALVERRAIKRDSRKSRHP